MVDQRSDQTLLIRERANELRGSDVDWDGEITAVTSDVEPVPPVRKQHDSAAEIDPNQLHAVTRNTLGILGAIPPQHRVWALVVLILAAGAGYVLYQTL